MSDEVDDAGGEAGGVPAGDGAVPPSPGPAPTVPNSVTISTDPMAARAPSYVASVPDKRGKGKLFALVGGCVALLAAGVFAVVTIAKKDDKGGAASPREAIAQLTAAVNRSDVLGVLDIVLPSERTTWGEPLIEMFDQAKRLELLAPQADLGGVKGVDVALVITPSEPVPVADDITIVPVTGTGRGAVDMSALPIGDLLLDNGVDPGESTQATPSGQTMNGRIATVQRDGRWYVSLWYSVAEAYRQRAGDLEWPAAGAALVPDGADTPEAAVTEMLDAFESLSLETVLRRVNPEEAEVLQRVAPWFLESAQEDLDRLIGQAGFSITFTKPEMTVRTDGDSAVVAVPDLGFDLEVNDVKATFADGCLTYSTPGQATSKQCPGTPAGLDQTVKTQLEDMDLGDLVDTVTKFSDDLTTAMADMPSQGIVVHRTGGQWFVSPVGTMLGVMVDLMKAFDRGEIDMLIDDARATLDGYSDAFSDFDSDFFTDSGVFSDTGSTDTDLTDTGSTDFGAESAYFDCEIKNTFETALACVQQGLEDGTFTKDVVTNGAFLAPECGWVGARYDAGLAALPDDQYVAKATAASACFQSKLAAGEVTELQVPFEVRKPECLLGKNPFAMTSDESDAYLSCIYGG